VRLTVVGTGYVGLVTGACLADKGHEVACVDLDEERVRAVNEGRAPIHEAGLEELLARTVGSTLRATVDLEPEVRASDASMIAVGTPFDGREIDLSFIGNAAGEIGAALAGRDAYHVVIVKSTVVPGTTDTFVRRVVEEASGKRAGDGFGLAMNPEFLTEGQAVDDFMHPDRLVLGGIDETTLDFLDELYAGFPEVPRIRTTPRAAEMIKYASNALLATAVSFSNELANLCTALGDVDIVDVMNGLHAGQYLTPTASAPGPVTAPIAAFFEAGCGFGGSCLPKDVSALVAHGEQAGVEMPLLRAVLATNARRAAALVGQLKRHRPDLRGARIAVLGLAFKPDTDDVRESPAIPVVETLLDEGATVTVHDPAALAALSQLFDGRVRGAADLEEAIGDADAVVIVTRWHDYEALPGLLAGLNDPPLVVDGRRMLEKASVERYTGIGL
jgi:UDPglucose 6-dehydrogenase